MGEEQRDLWSRIPGVWRAVIAIAAIWAAGATSSWAAQEYRGLPDMVADHELRIGHLEQARQTATDRNNRNFIYVACRLDELTTGGSGARCDLILDDETRSLLRQLRSP